MRSFLSSQVPNASGQPCMRPTRICLPLTGPHVDPKHVKKVTNWWVLFNCQSQNARAGTNRREVPFGVSVVDKRNRQSSDGVCFLGESSDDLFLGS